MLKFILQCEKFFTFGEVSMDLTKLHIKSLSLTILTGSFFPTNKATGTRSSNLLLQLLKPHWVVRQLFPLPQPTPANCWLSSPAAESMALCFFSRICSLPSNNVECIFLCCFVFRFSQNCQRLLFSQPDFMCSVTGSSVDHFSLCDLLSFLFSSLHL